MNRELIERLVALANCLKANQTAFVNECTTYGDVGMLRQAAEALAAQEQDAVLWQCRYRPRKASPWGDWQECTQEEYDDIVKRKPVMWEARALCTAMTATGEQS